MSKRSVDPILVEKVRMYREKGLSSVEISRILPISKAMVYYIARTRLLPPAPREEAVKRQAERKERRAEERARRRSATTNGKILVYVEALSVIMARNEGEAGRIAREALERTGALVE